MVAAARELGLDEIGISDHFTAYPDDRKEHWTMSPDRLDGYVEEVLTAARESVKPVVRLGLEADYFPETVDMLRECVARYPFDYIIGSVHFIDTFPIDLSIERWRPLDAEEIVSKWRLYWTRIGALAASGVFDFVGHLDLPKKFGYFMPDELIPDALSALDAVAAAGMAIEINTSGWYVPAEEAYPSTFLLRAACERGIALVINADAHQPAHVSRDFERAREMARAAGYNSVVRYERRRRFSVPL